jgi:hypothetical protein
VKIYHHLLLFLTGSSAVSSSAVETPIYRLPAMDFSLGAAALEKPGQSMLLRYIVSYISTGEFIPQAVYSCQYIAFSCDGQPLKK